MSNKLRQLGKENLNVLYQIIEERITERLKDLEVSDLDSVKFTQGKIRELRRLNKEIEVLFRNETRSK